MRSGYAWLAGVLVAGGLGGSLLWLLPKSHQPQRALVQRMFDRRDRRCRGGCTASVTPPLALLSILPGGPTAGQIAAGTLTAATGQTVADARASHKFCSRPDGGMVELLNDSICVESNGINVEPASTNLVLRSTDVCDPGVGGWGTASAACTPTACAAPDGTMTGTQVDFADSSGGGATNVIYQVHALTSGHWTTSVYEKLLSGSPTKLCFTETPDGVTTHSQCDTPTGGWQRISLRNWLATTTSWVLEIGVDNRDPTVPPQPAFSACIWGAQVEKLTRETSVIATGGAPASRDQDLVSVSGLTISPGFCVAATLSSANTAYDSPHMMQLGYPESGDGNNFNMVLSISGGATGKLSSQTEDNSGTLRAISETSGVAFANNVRFSVCLDAAGATTLYRDGSSVATSTVGSGTGVLASVPSLLQLGAACADVTCADSVDFLTLTDICIGQTHETCS